MQILNSNVPGISLIATLISSIISSLIISVIYPLGDELTLQSFLASFIVMMYFSLIGNSFLGIPLFLILVKLKLVRWWIWIPCAIIAGIFLQYGIHGSIYNWDKEDFLTTMPLALNCAFVFRFTLAYFNGWEFASS